MGVAVALAREGFRRRRAALAVIALVLAGGVGAALTSLEVAERTRHAYPDYLHRAAVGELVVNPSLVTEKTEALIRSVPGVVRVRSDSLLNASAGKGTSDFLKPVYAGIRKDLREPGTNALFLDLEGRLILCEHGNRRLARMEKDGKTRTTLVDRYQGTLLNSPNDGCVKSNGDIYFTDPPYGRWVKKPAGTTSTWN